jgi:hypothetical protein
MESSPAGIGAINNCKRIESENWAVEVYRSVEGGGTGQEFTGNLKINVDGPGNKWYDCWSGPTWIKGSFKEPKRIRKIVLQSANDCPERDPYNILFYKNDEKEENLLASYQHVTFKDRYLKKEFIVDSVEPVETIKIVFEENKSFHDSGNWGSGTQLAQVIFYYQE